MCYVRQFQLKLEPLESYRIIRNCSGCGGKSFYRNTKSFRVNANGNKIDIWLIYQCETCKHTFNLSIYERVSPNEITRDQYEGFLRNDEKLANEYGFNLALFSRNKAMIDDKGLNYKITAKSSIAEVNSESIEYTSGDLIEVENYYGLKVRTEKIISEILRVSRSMEQKLEKEGRIQVDSKNPDRILRIWVKGELQIG